MLADKTITGANITGATNVNVTGGATLKYTGHTTEVFDLSEDGTGLTATRTTDSTGGNSITVTIADALGTLTLGDAGDSSGDGYEYKTVNLVVGGAGSATLAEADVGTDQTDEGWFGTDESIVVTGSGDVTLNIAGALLGANTASSTAVAATVSGASHAGVLTVDIGQLGANEFFEASKLTGVDVLRLSTGSGDDDTVLNLLADTSVYVDGIENVVNELTVDPNGSGTSDVLDITLAHATDGESIDLNAFVADGFETVNITSSGTNSSSTTVNNVLDSIAGLSTDTTLNISGDKAFTATGIEATWTTISSTNTAGVDLTVASGGALSYTGGAGDDRLELNTLADITSADAIDGGEGTNTLAISELIGADFSAAQRAVVSNIQTLEYVTATQTLTGAKTLDLTKLSEVDKLKIGGTLTTDTSDGDSLTLTVNDGFTLEMGGHTGSGGGADELVVSVSGAADAGSDDTVNLRLVNFDDATASASDTLEHDGLQIDGVETLTITMLGDEVVALDTSDVADNDNADTYVIADIDGAQLTSIILSSANTGTDSDGDLLTSDAITITDVESQAISLVDATAMTGAVDVSGLGGTSDIRYIGTGATIKGGSGADALDGGAGADVIEGNAGNDTLKGHAGNDQIHGGAGNDSITGGAGADDLYGGAGDDTFIVGLTDSSTVAGRDQIFDFEAAPSDTDHDTLNLANAATASKADDKFIIVADTSSAVDVKDATDESGETSTDVVASVSSGIMTVSGDLASNLDTLDEWFAAAKLVLAPSVATGAQGIHGEVVAFEFEGSTFVVQEQIENPYTGSSDSEVLSYQLVELVGTTGKTLGISAAADTILLS